MKGLNTVEARVWSKHLNKEIVVKLGPIEANMLCEDGYADELKHQILFRAMNLIGAELKIKSITMDKVCSDE